MLFKSKNSRRNVTLVFGAVFFLGMGQSMISMFTASTNQNAAEASNTPVVEQVDLETGYKLVLEREPENETALEALVGIQLANQKLDEAKVNLEKLIAIRPENEVFATLLEQVNQDLTAQNLDEGNVEEQETSIEDVQP